MWQVATSLTVPAPSPPPPLQVQRELAKLGSEAANSEGPMQLFTPQLQDMEAAVMQVGDLQYCVQLHFTGASAEPAVSQITPYYPLSTAEIWATRPRHDCFPLRQAGSNAMTSCLC